MGEKFHYARICDAALIEELSAAASASVAQRDDTPLRAFWAGHADRRRRVDAFRVPLDLERIVRAQEALSRAAVSSVKEEVRALAKGIRKASLVARDVGKTAQDTLIARAARVTRMLEIDAPHEIQTAEIAHARAALAALDTADLSVQQEQAGLASELWDGELVERCLHLCLVPGRDDDVGLGAIFTEAFVEGSALVTMPTIGDDDDPPSELFERVLERFGVYSAECAWELFVEDWLRFASTFTYYSPPAWTVGAGLEQAAARVEAASLDQSSDEDVDDIEELQRAFADYRRALLDAAAQGHAVVEWVEKV